MQERQARFEMSGEGFHHSRGHGRARREVDGKEDFAGWKHEGPPLQARCNRHSINVRCVNARVSVPFSGEMPHRRRTLVVPGTRKLLKSTRFECWNPGCDVV